MTVALVIPARYASSRLPGKPLLSVAGISLIERVWKIANAVQGVSKVVVATDDERILKAVEAFGGVAIMTPADCKNGTERVYAALAELPETVSALINLQGDAVLTPPWIIDPLVTVLSGTTEAKLVTPAVQLTKAEYVALRDAKREGSSSGTLVVTDTNGKAMYFSKSMIPFMRGSIDGFADSDFLPVYRHIGLYGYTRVALEAYLRLPEGVLEKAEGLEQLRALENGMEIEVVPVSYNGRTHGSVDNREDIALVEAIIAKEGELI
jgi:3-deoxy-manno-octulosonate cytidylyltransferase (CMP-KDO synthetase)